ncbi:grasp-with-spasm system SPASM domain peptide maturase [Pedobacter jeongneungensis]|uniref:grasp-with-spasm system SPASM domain peptide maturase n=1 Tax=Pedobacter jeongneungensis TaxID=947309 RepID=UPI00046AD71B|nr:grasp-with-spasm system SPASM domain peptide maturase [Pedobacter jeongneungensis]
MIKDNVYIKLFACCILVKGAKRATIVDIQRHDYMFVPLGISEILEEGKSRPIEEVLQGYNAADVANITKYLDHLITREYAFRTTEPELYPRLSLEWKNSSLISNAIIDFDYHSDYPVEPIIDQLEKLGCETVQVRYFDAACILWVSQLLSTFARGMGKIRNIQLVLGYSREMDKSSLIRLMQKHERLTEIIIHSAPEESLLIHQKRYPLRFIKQEIKDESHCGFVSPKYFRINAPFFIESQHFNSCLNAKVSVDKNGMIKNCPAMDSTYGHVNDLSIDDVVIRQDYLDWGNISKDQVEGCSDCEFRYICSDCRVFTKTGGRYAKPASCTYNPYTMSWEQEPVIKEKQGAF